MHRKSQLNQLRLKKNGSRRFKVLVVGAFPEEEKKIYGGFVTVCGALIDSSFEKCFNLVLIDSTQASNPRPSLFKRAYRALRRFCLYNFSLFNEKPNAVLIFTASGIGLLEKGLMGRSAQLMGIPNLMFPGGGYLLKNYDFSYCMRLFAEIALKKADKILCQGRQWQDFAVHNFGFKINNAPIVENWTATESLLQIGRNRNYRKSPKAKLRLLFVGWLDKEKGVLEILEAISSSDLKEKVTIEFVGKGNVDKEAEEIIYRNGLSKTVVFRGWLQGKELHDAYARAEVFLLPSWMEGLPNAMVEAMSAGLVPLVSAVGNVPSCLEHGKNGFLLEPKNPVSIQKALEQILADELTIEKFGKEAHFFAEKNFATEIAVQKLTSVIMDAIEEKNSSRL